MIQRTPKGYVVLSAEGKKLGGPYKSRAAALKRMGQMEYYKRKK